MYKKLRLLTTMLLLAVCCGTWADDTYVKITSTSELEVGAEYLFASETSSSDQRDNVMGAISTYGARVDLLKSGTTGTIVVSNNDKVNVITLGGSEGSWTFHTSIEGKYVSWSSGNSLSVLDNANENSAQWTIQIASDGKATIANKGTSARLLQYNSSSPRFACYTSSQTKFCLYKKQEGGSTPTETCANPSFSPVGGTYTSAQTVTLSCATAGASIYYRIDGTEPTADTTDGSLLYSSPITVDVNMTIKAIAVKEGMENSAVADATYTIVNIEHAGTEADPYTVADARAAIDANTGITNVYATGIVSEIVTAYDSRYGNITYNISADGTTTADQLEVYRGKSYDGADFTSDDDIQVGDVVVVYGTLKKYGNTYEFAQDNQLVSLQRPVITTPSISLSETTIEATADETDGTINVTYNNITDVEAEVKFYEADGETPATYDWITAVINNANNVEYIIEANTGEARTAYMKVYALDDEANDVYSELITITQAEYVAPVIPTGNSYVKVTSTDDITTGQYLIVYEGDETHSAVAFNGGLETLDAVSNTIGVTIENNEIAATTATEAAEFTIDVTAGTIKSASGYDNGQTSDANGMNTSTETAYTNTISIDGEGYAVILASGGAYLRYNSASNQERFRYYKSSSYTNQKAIQLY